MRPSINKNVKLIYYDPILQLIYNYTTEHIVNTREER